MKEEQHLLHVVLIGINADDVIDQMPLDEIERYCSWYSCFSLRKTKYEKQTKTLIVNGIPNRIGYRKALIPLDI